MIVVGGPTASGKTSLAIELAQYFGTAIISADSRQFYREMAIGNARPTTEELTQATHYFVADRSLDQALSAGRFADEALKLAQQLFEEQEYLVCVGGSGLYIQALCEGLDEFPPVGETAREEVQRVWTSAGLSGLQQALAQADPDYYQQVDQQNPRRLQRALEVCWSTDRPYSSFLGNAPKRPFESYYFRTNPAREALYDRINQRVDQMFALGLEEEAQRLYPYRDLAVLQTVGYQEFWPYFAGEYDLARVRELIQRNSRRYAKRQFTWFKRGDKYRAVNNLQEVIRELKQA